MFVSKWLYPNHAVLAWHTLCVKEGRKERREGEKGEKEEGREVNHTHTAEYKDNIYNPNTTSTMKKSTCFSWCSFFSSF